MSTAGGGSLREQMPEITAWIDWLRGQLGRDVIDAQIRRGMRGEPVFYAEENGCRIGTPLPAGKQLPPVLPNQRNKESADTYRRRRA